MIVRRPPLCSTLCTLSRLLVKGQLRADIHMVRGPHSEALDCVSVCAKLSMEKKSDYLQSSLLHSNTQ